jgi:predicted amidohydrolase
MSELVLAAAQTRSVKGAVEANAQRHLDCVLAAAAQGVDLLVFPELSLTGYEPELAAELVLAPDDERLRGLRAASQVHGLTVIVGAPIASDEGRPHLGALILEPGGARVYAKQHLHPGEERFFVPGPRMCVVDVKGLRIGVAICADTARASHPQEAAASGAAAYVAGVLITESGYAADAALLRGYASTHRMAVAMANHSTQTGGWTPAGKSAIWDERGDVVARANGTEEALVIAEKTGARWQGRVVPLS